MNAYSLVALVALLLSVLTFIASQLTSRRVASGSYRGALEDRLRDAELEKTRLRDRIKTLEEENFHLMRKLIKLENGT